MSATPDTAFQKQRISIGLAIGPNPPWTNKHFVCECGAEFQFGCADELREVVRTDGAYLNFETPPCWCCDRAGILTIPVPVPEIEGNPS
jgi:hypothetical protein